MRQIIIVVSAALSLVLAAGSVKTHASEGKPIVLALNPQPEPPNKNIKKPKPQKIKKNIPNCGTDKTKC